MKLKKLLLGCAIAVAVSAFGQANKPVLVVEDFTGSADKAAITLLRNNVIAGIQASGRVDVFDSKNGTKANANGLLKGNVDNVTCTREQTVDKDGKKYVSYKAKVLYSLSVVDAANGNLISHENFDNIGTGGTDAEAVQAALQIKKSPLERFINNAYKVDGKILALDDHDAKKAKTLYISLGSNDGIKKGQKMEVFKEVEIAGETSRKLVGDLTIVEVMGPSRSLCKVGKGGDVILVEFNKGTNMPVCTKEEKGNFFKSIIED